MTEQLISVGKRKTAVAQVYLKPGDGKMAVNGRDADKYFNTESAKIQIRRPFMLTETLGKYDVYSIIKGGGLSAQSEALRHGISRVLAGMDESYRKILKDAGLITRDAREKERKKYGLAGARRAYQFSKR